MKRVQESGGPFYARSGDRPQRGCGHGKAEVADLNLRIPHADPLLNVRAGVHTIGVSGNALTPFQVDRTIPALCTLKAKTIKLEEEKSRVAPEAAVQGQVLGERV